MAFRKYPSFTRQPRHSLQLLSEGSPVSGGSGGATVAPWWRHRMQAVGMSAPAHQLLAFYGAPSGSSGGGAKPWLYLRHTKGLGTGFQVGVS